jgi:hypothetical protein
LSASFLGRRGSSSRFSMMAFSENLAELLQHEGISQQVKAAKAVGLIFCCFLLCWFPFLLVGVFSFQGFQKLKSPSFCRSGQFVFSGPIPFRTGLSAFVFGSIIAVPYLIPSFMPFPIQKCVLPSVTMFSAVNSYERMVEGAVDLARIQEEATPVFLFDNSFSLILLYIFKFD